MPPQLEKREGVRDRGFHADKSRRINSSSASTSGRKLLAQMCIVFRR
jgi:hypothetical protein